MSTVKATATSSASSTFPIFGFATVVLFILKIGKVGAFADISWWLVLAPVLVGLGLWVIGLVVVLVAIVIAAFVSTRR